MLYLYQLQALGTRELVREAGVVVTIVDIPATFHMNIGLVHEEFLLRVKVRVAGVAGVDEVNVTALKQIHGEFEGAHALARAPRAKALG